MPLSSYIVEGRAHLLARAKLIFDLLLALGLYLSGAPLAALLAPAADMIFLAPYLRYVKRSPALLTFVALTLWAVLLALAPLALGATGMLLWALYPVLPAFAGFVLARRSLMNQMAVITAAALAAGAFLVLQNGPAWVLDMQAIAVFGGAVLVSIALLAWLMGRVLRPESGSRDALGQPVTVARGVMVVPFNWLVGGVQVESLRLELHELKRRHNPRWVVLDLAPAGEVGSHDLHAIERAAEDVSTPQCTLVLARPPVDTISHLDVAQPVIHRIERFATVAQAVEAGLRRLGWTQGEQQGRRVVTTY